MRAVWGYYESNSIQGKSNSNMVRSFNALKRELTRQQNSLFIDHQQEDVVSGGFANTIQFHYLLLADTTEMSSTTVVATAATFDANQGAVGTADVYFETRRDFYEPGRGF